MATHLITNVLEGNKYNRDIITMTMPLYLMSVFFYGPRVVVLAVLAVLAAKLTDRLAAVVRSRKYDKLENSSVTIALILTLMLPASVPIYVVVVTVMLTIWVAKEAFGGFMAYPFNPSAVGFCIAAVCWPQAVLRYPQPSGWLLRGTTGWDQLWKLWTFDGVTLAAGPSMTLRNGGLPKIDVWSLILGDYAGPLGVGCAVVIAACALYLIIRRRLPLWAPAAFMVTAAVLVFVFPRYEEISFRTWPQDFWLRLQVVKFEIFSGGMLFTAVFLVDEPSTLPRYSMSQLVYGVLLGLAVVLFRYFGTYELGTCFAIVLVNAFSGFFDRAIGQLTMRRAARKEAAA